MRFDENTSLGVCTNGIVKRLRVKFRCHSCIEWLALPHLSRTITSNSKYHFFMDNQFYSTYTHRSQVDSYESYLTHRSLSFLRVVHYIIWFIVTTLKSKYFT